MHSERQAAGSAVSPVVYPRGQHKISRSDIDPDALKIMYRLLRHQYKAYLVGGGVRDLLLGKKPKDFDISTDATPNQIKGLFRNCRIIGRRFKLAHIFFHGGKIIEVSTFRDESAPVDPDSNDSEAHPRLVRDNTYGTAATDAVRRDITINGLFYDLATFSVIDYVGGMEDLAARVIRVIGEPARRFTEDPVRMLRVIRHAARAGFAIEPGVEASIRHNSSLILQAVLVRVYEELKKDLGSGYSASILRLLTEHGLLKHLLPNLAEESGRLLSEHCPLFISLSRADNFIREGRPINTTVVLGLIALFTGTDARSILELPDALPSSENAANEVQRAFGRLPVPRKERQRIEDMIFLWQRLLAPNRKPPKLQNLKRNPALVDLLQLLDCLGMGTDSDPVYSLIAEAAADVHETERRRGRFPGSAAQRQPAPSRRRKSSARRGGGRRVER